MPTLPACGTAFPHRATCILLFAALLATALAGCGFPKDLIGTPRSQPAAPFAAAWKYADLRLLDPPGDALAEHDLLAVYLRSPNGSSSSRFDIRLDFLDMPIRSQLDVFIALDYKYGGTAHLPLDAVAELQWDALLHIPASGSFSVINEGSTSLSDLSVLLLRNPEKDSLEIRLDAAALYPALGSGAPPELSLQVFIAPQGSVTVADQSTVIHSYSPPPEPAHLLLAFWNTYPAYTPAQALRRWDGAHTGPLGGRHGLSNLLRTSASAGIPLVLLDLQYPAWLSALDYAGNLDRVREQASRGLVLLPEVIPPVEDLAWHAYSRELAHRFDLPGTVFAYTQSPSFVPSRQSFIFFPDPAPNPVTAIAIQEGRRLLPLPVAGQADLQPDLTGLSLAARRQLVDTALHGGRAGITVLGGDLTLSTWGNPQIARAAFRYIHDHPWIRPLNAADLLSMPALAGISASSRDGEALFASVPQMGDTLSFIPEELGDETRPLVDAAAQATLASAPPAVPASSEYAALQQVYISQTGVLLSADRWAQAPAPIGSCDLDPDQDGLPECVLASEVVFAVFDPRLGALTHAFALTPAGAHQFIAPSSQFTFGTGDPTTWQPELGLAADPQVIPGVFYEGGGPYQAEIFTNRLTLTDPSSRVVKTFSLLPDGLRVAYRSPDPGTVLLPLALDPWNRFSPGWGDHYQNASLSSGWVWSVSPGLTVEITSDARLQPSAFTDSREMMNRVEDPNTELPPGHYLPFPMQGLQISGDPDFWLEIRVIP